jgi:two-component system chemotaxis response regulator CheY
MVSILIVDDSLDNLSLLSDFLTKRGYEISQCNSGNEALDILQNRTFDLVISDYQMPNGNGLWLLEEIQKLISPPKVIIMSSDNSLPENFFQSKGAQAFLQRPVDWNTLDFLIRDLKLN